MLWWQHFQKAFTPDECADVREYALTFPAKHGTIGHGGTSAVNESIRKSSVRWLQREDPLLAWFYARIERMALQANANGFGFDLCGLSGGFHEIQFTEYHADQSGHYDWHTDNTWNIARPFDRKMSMVIQLSPKDDYTGGRLELHNDPLGPEIFTDVGDVIFFPSFNRHRVTPVKLGVRYSLVTWFMGPKLR